MNSEINTNDQNIYNSKLEKISAKEKEILSNNPQELDILKELALWGYKQSLKENDLDALKDILSKISECNVLIYNLINNNTDDATKLLLKENLQNWITKEPTTLDFKAKYR